MEVSSQLPAFLGVVMVSRPVYLTIKKTFIFVRVQPVLMATFGFRNWSLD